MSQLGDLLRETADGTRSGRSMMMSLLEEDQMDGRDQSMSKWSTLKRRFGLDWVGCCGGVLLRQSETPIVDEEESQNRVVDLPGPGTELDCLTRGRTRNLSEALEEERLAHVSHVTTETSVKVPLMKLLAESDGCDEPTWLSYDPVCCVCMGREKGTAFIPCGHTYCRLCSREIWMNHGTCPLCNRSILTFSIFTEKIHDGLLMIVGLI